MHLIHPQVSLLVGVGGVAALLFMILRAKVQPFVALLVAALGVGLLAESRRRHCRRWWKRAWAPPSATSP